jgi:hypothetical protein
VSDYDYRRVKDAFVLRVLHVGTLDKPRAISRMMQRNDDSLGAKQAAEKGRTLVEKPEKHTSGAEALVVLISFIAGMNPRPTTRRSFSATYKAHIPDKKPAWTRRSTLQPAGRPALQFHTPWVGEADGRLLRDWMYGLKPVPFRTAQHHPSKLL